MTIVFILYMGDKMNDNNIFNLLCQKDIEDIYNIIKPYLPDFDIGNLSQSIIYESHKKILCRSIKNSSKEIIGKELMIQVYDTGEIYKLIYKENSIKLEKIHQNANEKVKIKLEDYIIKRSFTYKEDEKASFLEETYNLNSDQDLNEYIKSNSIEETMNKLKNKNKIRKRT